MAILRSSVPVLITFSVLSFFLTYPPPLLSATAADGTELATEAYSNATDTRDYITSKIKSGGGKPETLRGLKKCLGYYEEAVRILGEMLGNLDSETFSGLDKLSVEAEGYPRACEKRFGGRSPITTRNDNLIKLANICYVVALLYEYH
ncbi:UNVERIFIED_CONTAM: hypothetical protein Scaly_1264700 [Sesamum calycinum]|uniref:Pectinesterase inhibitor domain-containing protein n=1 Tax=Sesamum calycinum TaxID=2727403 RepID=A0AAW2Q5D6_9LAMI